MLARVWHFALFFALPVVALAQPVVDRDSPIFMQADQLGYDNTNAIVVARGNVEISQGKSLLYADRIVYYQNYNIVRADGNVRVHDPQTGETYFADRVQLKEDLKQGIVQQFSARFADNSQFAAREARKISDTTTELSKAVYSPCDICEGKSPFWQLKADAVEIDDENEVVEYEDLYLEFYGVPVLYTPYFFHPTPDANRKSGFLKPEYSQSSNLGTSLKAPYYLNLGPDKDATITPFMTSEEGLVLESEYRQITDNGFFQINASGTYPKKRDDDGLELSDSEFRGHIFAKGDSNVNEHWRWGFDVRRATDDTYLRRYRFSGERTLGSRIFTEGLYGRSYFLAQGLTFQGLEEDIDPDREPFVIPLIEGYYESDPGFAGARHYSGGNIQAITRKDGVQSRRASLSSGVKIPVTTSGGHLIDADLRSRADIYSVEDQRLSDGTNFDGEKLRLAPQASVKWRYPVVKHMEHSSLTVEPTVLALAQPNGLNPQEIPNEDNRIVEFTDAHLFSTNPMPGSDTVDEGSRVAYGLRAHWLFNSGKNLQFLFGQNYSAQDETPFPYNDEPGEHFSDYVGRVAFDYDPFQLAYHFRLDRDNLNPNSNTVSTALRLSPVTLNLDYVSLENDQFLQDREEVLAAMAIALSDQWSVSASARRDLISNDMLYAGSGLVFRNECFTLDARFDRQFTRDRDVEPDTSFSVRVSFKNLNEL